MRISLDSLRKDQILWLAKHKCKHNHSYLEHENCYYKEVNKDMERIGFIDIECSNLNADYGILLTYCIKDSNSKKIYFDKLNIGDVKRGGHDATEDKRLIQNLMKDMLKFDKLVGHYSSRFDLQYIRTRAIMCKLKFPEFGTIFQADTWNILKHKFKLSRNSLESGTRNLLGVTRKNHLSLILTNRALRGDPWALNQILTHNKYDVLDTEDLYKIIEPYMRKTKTSI